MILSAYKVLNGTAMQDLSTLVGGTNSGRLVQAPAEVNTETINWRGTLLRGIVSAALAKSSTCRATTYNPVLPVASYCKVHSA